MRRPKVRKRLPTKLSRKTRLAVVRSKIMVQESWTVTKLSLSHVQLSQGMTRLALKTCSFHLMPLPMLRVTQRNASWPSMQ